MEPVDVIFGGFREDRFGNSKSKSGCLTCKIRHVKSDEWHQLVIDAAPSAENANSGGSAWSMPTHLTRECCDEEKEHQCRNQVQKRDGVDPARQNWGVFNNSERFILTTS